jgi:hypothetical protein
VRRSIKNIVDVCLFFLRIVDATLSGALVAITSSTRAKLLEHYERDAPILSEESVERLIRGAKCLDEMDGDSLAEIQLERIVSFCAFI